MSRAYVLTIALVLAGMLLFSAVAAQTPAPKGVEKPKVKIPDKQMVAQGNNEFALDLYAKLRQQKGNLFFSPYSISTALAMTYAGARGNTATQMAETLHFTLDQDRLHPAFQALIKDLNPGRQEGYELVTANALWGQQGYGFLPRFLELTEKHYGAGLKEVDFAGDTEGARKAINTWVEQQTRDKIKDLIQRGILNDLTRLVLTNAIYFKGNWAEQFNQDRTTEAPFTLITGEKIDVPTMNQMADFKYMEEKHFQTLEMAYAGDKLAMTILLPRKVDGLTALEKSLTARSLRGWLKKLRRRRVLVTLPRFKLTTRFQLNDVLKSLGMKDAFVFRQADFSGMNGKRDLYISDVIHQAFVDVNEEGTEAAAATAVVATETAASRPPIFRADHPFIFLIRDTTTNSILFLGRMMNPKG